MTRCASWRSSRRASISGSSDWPMSTIWMSFSVSVSRLEMRRICSSTSGDRSCASSSRSTTSRSAARASSRKRCSASTWSLSDVPVAVTWRSSRIVAQQLDRRHRGVEDDGGGGARVEAGKEVAGESRLARSHLAGDEDEAALLLATELQVGERLGVALGQVQVLGVRGQVERLLREAVVALVHLALRRRVDERADAVAGGIAEDQELDADLLLCPRGARGRPCPRRGSRRRRRAAGR